MTYETIKLETDGRGVATVVLARAEKHNVMNAAMIGELDAVARSLAHDEKVRVIVLAAEGKSFCAGGDLNWMKEQFAADRAGKMRQAKSLAGMLGRWNAMPKPVIGRVQGAAYGGGLGLIAVCDTVVAAQECRFALTETRLGLIPATIGPFVVARLGEAFARQVFITAKPFGVDFLVRAGMVARAAPADRLDELVEEEIAAALECAPGAMAAAKSLVLQLAGSAPLDQIDMTAAALADRWEREETKAGISAFFARETPPWRS